MSTQDSRFALVDRYDYVGELGGPKLFLNKLSKFSAVDYRMITLRPFQARYIAHSKNCLGVEIDASATAPPLSQLLFVSS